MADWTRKGEDVIIDVRDDLRAGREPFADIMGALEEVPSDGRLILRATFRPTPLIELLASRGIVAEAVQHGEEDWEVTFRQA